MSGDSYFAIRIGAHGLLWKGAQRCVGPMLIGLGISLWLSGKLTKCLLRYEKHRLRHVDTCYLNLQRSAWMSSDLTLSPHQDLPSRTQRPILFLLAFIMFSKQYLLILFFFRSLEFVRHTRVSLKIELAWLGAAVQNRPRHDTIRSKIIQNLFTIS